MASESMDEDIDIPAGWVMEMTLRNFMCHGHLKVVFIKHVNFITGQNGSGKSAILTALCVAFGSKAKGTQRALQLADFIKTGESTATVEIIMDNEGSGAYQPEIFGNRITIIRRLNRGGASHFELRDSRGSKVYSNKEEVEKLAKHFYVDVLNPCVVMSQDKSREFLHSGSDKDKYKLFTEATLLKDIDIALAGVGEKIAFGRESINLMGDFVQKEGEKLKELDNQIEELTEGQRMSEEIAFLTKMCCWSAVKEMDEKMQAMKNSIGTKEEELEAHKECLAGLEVDLEAARLARENHGSSTGSLEEERKREQDKLQLLMDAIEKAAEEQGLAKGRVETAQDRVRDSEAEAVRLRRLIDDEIARATTATQSQAAELSFKMQEARQIATAKGSELERLRQARMEHEGQRHRLADRATAIQSNLQQTRERMTHHQAWMNRLKQDAGSKMTTSFGHRNLPQLLRAIEEERHCFTYPPVGPLGDHLELLEGQYATAIESNVGHLNAFAVGSKADAETLRRVAARANYPMHSVLTTNFEMPPITWQLDRVPDASRFKTIESVLKFGNPVVRNLLIDLHGIERKVLVKDYNEGKVAYIPDLQIDACIDLEGNRTLLRHGDEKRERNYQNHRQTRLKLSNEDSKAKLRQAEGDLEAMRQEKRGLEEQLSRVNAEIQRLDQIFPGMRNKELLLETDVSINESEMKALQSQEEEERQQPSTGDVEKSREELQTVEAGLLVLRRNLEEARSVFDEKTRIFEDISRQQESLARALKEIVNKQAAEENKALDLVAVEAQVAKNKEYYTAEKDKIVGVLQNLLQTLEAEEKRAEAYRSTVSEKYPGEPSEAEWAICPRAGEGTLAQHLNGRIKLLKTRLEKKRDAQAGAAVTLERVQRKRTRAQWRRDQHAEQVNKFTARFDRLEKSLNRHFIKVKHMSANFRNELGVAFRKNLRTRMLKGRVVFGEDTLALELETPGDGSGKRVQDTRSLSGGERSFATLCFTLALHNLVSAPFRAMDEFDVFMDNMTRKVALREAIGFALKQPAQWIFISPNDITSVQEGPRVKRLMMNAPRP